jgi:hypothetical protein
MLHSETVSDAPWEQLRKPGKNGFLLVMVSLVWWGKAAEADDEWKKAVEDVVEALRGMRLVGGGTSAIPLPLQESIKIHKGKGRKRKRKEEDGEKVSDGRPSRKAK